MFVKFLAASIFSSEKRISFPGELPVASAKRSASAPYFSMISIGSMPLPSDFDIFLPSASRTRPWMNTVENGSFPVCSIDENIILDTQNEIMSYPVTSTSVGKKRFRSSVSCGQPSVENGQSADENHVSSTSSS